MVLNPTWTITNNLVRRDLIPVLRTNPGYLEAHNIHVFAGGKEVPLDFARLAKAEHGGAIPYRFVQFPSDKNALGRVKFMFPNKYSVYLHDTDNHSLFKYRYRVFSSGCMRVSKPFDFMNILLRHAKGSYTESKIKQIFATNKPTTIRLSRAIPVHVLYNTAYREDGKDYFLYDIYMYDQMIYESSAGHTKSTFTVPKKRLTGIKRVSRIQR
jgi:murein L,D-transpeptidase YcbB/YkuD